MSEFEYLTVVVSIILGLGITHLLSGIGRTIHRRAHTRLDAVHTIWTVVLFHVLVLNWWVFFQWREQAEWSFGTFLMVVVWAVIFYLMAVVLYPPDLTEREDFGEVFERNRSWFLGLFVASSVADIALTATLGDLLNPPHYLPFVAHFIVLGLLGLVWHSRRFHLALASWVLVIALSWSFIVRRFLT
jgi:hypothetical protein